MIPCHHLANSWCSSTGVICHSNFLIHYRLLGKVDTALVGTFWLKQDSYLSYLLCFCSSNSGNRKKHSLPPVINLDNEGNGRYTHFGLESALAGESPEEYFHHADLLQYAAIYKSNPNALPPSIRKKVLFFIFNPYLFLHFKSILL